MNDDQKLGPDQEELADQLPDDIDPHEMAETLEDELLAEEGAEFGLDPDLAVFVAEEELAGDEDAEPPA
jgi:hypothetical protein